MQKRAYILFVILIICFVTSCQRGKMFYVTDDHGFANARELQAHVNDNDWLATNRSMDINCHNYYWDGFYPDDSIKDAFRNAFVELPHYYLRVHRFHGEVDTFYIRSKSVLPVGYVQRIGEYKNWMVFECKRAYEILGYTHLVDEASKNVPLSQLQLYNYTYEGQRVVFDSEISWFWIADNTSLNLYGPLRLEHLKQQLARMSISLPLTLEACANYYAMEYPYRTDNSNGIRWKDRVPKDYYYPHWTYPKDRVIK